MTPARTLVTLYIDLLAGGDGPGRRVKTAHNLLSTVTEEAFLALGRDGAAGIGEVSL